MFVAVVAVVSVVATVSVVFQREQQVSRESSSGHEEPTRQMASLKTVVLPVFLMKRAFIIQCKSSFNWLAGNWRPGKVPYV